MNADATLSWLSWVCAALFFFYAFFQRTSPSAYYTDLESEFNLDGAGVGSLSSTYFYAYAIAQIPYGVFMDKFGALRVIAFCAFGAFIGALCFSLSYSLVLLYFGRTLVGGFVGVSWISAVKIIQDDDYFQGKKQLLTGTSMSIGMLGGSLGQGPLAALCKSSGWRFAMSITSVVPIFVSVSTAIVYIMKSGRNNNESNGVSAAPATAINIVINVDDKNNDEKKNSIIVDGTKSRAICQNLIAALRVKLNIYLCLYMFFSYVPLLAFASLWAVPFFTQVGNVDRPTAGLIATCYIVGTGLGAPLGGALSDRFKGNERQIMMCSLLLTSSMILLAMFATGNWHIIFPSIFMLLAGLGQGPHMVLFHIAKTHNTKESVGTGLAIINTGGILAGAVFQTLIGALIDLGWEGKVGKQGERLWPANHLRFTLGTVLTCCLIFSALIVLFLIPPTKSFDTKTRNEEEVELEVKMQN